MRARTGLRRFFALIALFSVFGTVGAAWHTAEDDFACAPLVFASGKDTASALTAAGPLTQSQHCALCHLGRWGRSVQSDRSAVIDPSIVCVGIHARRAAGAVHGRSNTTFGRAPPA